MDLTDSKLPEAAVGVNLKGFLFLTEALQHLSDAFLAIDLRGTLLFANETARKFFSLPRDGTEGCEFWDLFPDDYFGFSMREALRFHLPHRLIYKSLRLLELEISSSFFFIGSSRAMALVARDLTERLKLQEALRHQERMQDLGEGAAQIAHEIRNPLGGIRGFASLLARDLAGQSHLQEMALAILEGTKALESLVAKILHFARPVQVHPRTVDLGPLLKQLGRFVKVDPAFPASVKMALHIPNAPVLAPVDSEALKSALLNLVFNAMQAMPVGGLLSLSLFQLEGCCQIAVTDTGVGMDPETLRHLFSPFFTTKKKGTGLGLVETEKIVKAHKGSIEVRSQVGKGTTFTVTLPLKR